MSLQTIKVKFNRDGTARITLPEGKSMLVSDPAKVAKLTEKLALKMGTITERHAAHSHIYLDASTGKMVHNEHDHID